MYILKGFNVCDFLHYELLQKKRIPFGNVKKIVKFACPNRFIVAFNIKFAPQENKKFAKGV